MKRRIIADILFGLVFISNMYCALVFIFDPASYVYSYEVIGSKGAETAIQGLGVAFAMWNVTYPFFIFSKEADKKLALAIIVQQLVGLVGELYIRFTMSEGLTVLASSIMRFVYFDAAGLLLLLAGYALAFGRKR